MENLNNLTIWDVKDVFNKVKNVVMNYTEMEAKVREATNNEPWGASSTLMQEIAQGTYNYQYFNEIMPTIYKRFTEKEARQWRQIYKALVLLEYLVKHGSERVVDDARAHMATIKIMRSFNFIDEKNRDQGINVRNRAKELAELLSDVEKIRAERKKAKANRTKYTSVSSDSIGYGGFGGSSSRYGGFSNGDSFGYDERSSRSRYDDFDNQWSNENRTSPSSPTHERRSSSSRSSLSTTKKANETNGSLSTGVTDNNEVNLFEFDEPPVSPIVRQSVGSELSSNQSTTAIDDDFADFQSAPPLAPPSQRSSITIQQNLTNLPLSQNNSSPVVFKQVHPNNSLIDDLLGSVAPVTSPSITTTSAQLPLGIATTNKTTSTSTQGISVPNFTPITPTNPKQETVNQSPGFPNLKTNDLWAETLSLVKLDSLGQAKDSNSIRKSSTAPTMNSLAQANNSSWAVKGTWNGNPQHGQPMTSQQPQDPFDLLM